MKNIILNLILLIVVSIIMYLLFANIFHVFYVRKYEIYDFDNEIMVKIKNSINELENTINKVKNLDDRVYSKEEYEYIIKTFDSELDTINNNELLAYKGVNKVFLTDILNFYMQKSISVSDQINLLNILSKYNKSIEDYILVYKTNWLSNSLAINEGFTKTFESYRYNTKNFMEYDINEGSQNKITALVYNYYNLIVTLDYHAKLVLKGGDSY